MPSFLPMSKPTQSVPPQETPSPNHEAGLHIKFLSQVDQVEQSQITMMKLNRVKGRSGKVQSSYMLINKKKIASIKIRASQKIA